MPRISAEYRARMCSFTYSDGRRCRLPRAATGEGYCPTHAAKLRKQRADECAGLLTEPTAHHVVSSTSLTFMLARLFALVANGHVPPKTSNALLRIVDGLRISPKVSIMNKRYSCVLPNPSPAPTPHSLSLPQLPQPPQPQIMINRALAPLSHQTSSSSASNNASPRAQNVNFGKCGK